VTRAIDLRTLDEAGADQLAAAVASAGLVCFPTDTVYGIGGVVAGPTVAAIARVKRRAADRPLQVVYPTVEALLTALSPGPLLTAAVRRLLPGPFTLVVPYPADLRCPAPAVAEWPAGAGEAPRRVATLGVRVPDWPPGARALARLPFPLLASSANPSGGDDPAALARVAPAVRSACDLVLDAGPTAGVSSCVLDLSGYEAGWGYRVLRPGAPTAADVEALLGGDEGRKVS
jgi:L-threonylcarbamoyladenylate synthase